MTLSPEEAINKLWLAKEAVLTLIENVWEVVHQDPLIKDGRLLMKRSRS